MTDPHNSDDFTEDAALQELAPFAALVGVEIVELILERAPRKVWSRVTKALDHYSKALRLIGVDEEMGAIRCIAAEEELVVAVFEWLKLKAASMPEHSDFIGKHKNHLVKLAFYPVLSQFGFILTDMLSGTIGPAGLEHRLQWQPSVVRSGDQVKLRLVDEDGKELVQTNPLDIAISLDGKTDSEVVDSMFEEMKENITKQRKMTVRQFVTTRADFRNKLLYAEDRGHFAMGESLQHLLDEVFSLAYRDLLWCLAVILSAAPVKKDYGLVSQFIALYRRVLIETKLL